MAVWSFEPWHTTAVRSRRIRWTPQEPVFHQNQAMAASFTTLAISTGVSAFEFRPPVPSRIQRWPTMSSLSCGDGKENAKQSCWVRQTVAATQLSSLGLRTPLPSRLLRCPVVSSSTSSYSGSAPLLSVTCSSRPRKKITSHHNKTRPKKHNPYDKNRKPTRYPRLPKPPPIFSLDSSEGEFERPDTLVSPP